LCPLPAWDVRMGQWFDQLHALSGGDVHGWGGGECLQCLSVRGVSRAGRADILSDLRTRLQLPQPWLDSLPPLLQWDVHDDQWDPRVPFLPTRELPEPLSVHVLCALRAGCVRDGHRKCRLHPLSAPRSELDRCGGRESSRGLL
jgi:hypothetical protein